MAYKYPYIPKPYYAATMFACKMIRQNGYFNKAIRTAANYYDVDADELEKHVRARQAAGQKRKKSSAGRKYHWYVVCLVMEQHGHEGTGIAVAHATNESNAISQALEKLHYDEYESRDFGYYIEALAETDTKDEAYDLARKFQIRDADYKKFYPYKESGSPKAVHA